MRIAWAIVAGLALGIGLATFSPAPQRSAQHARSSDQSVRTNTAAKPAHATALYRWRDEAGVLQITDQPPKARPYERVRLREDQNVVPMTSPPN